MRKILSVLLCLSMVMTIVACSKKNDNSTASDDNNVTESVGAGSEDNTSPDETTGDGIQTSKIDFDEEPYTIHICYAVLGEAQPDLPLIQEKLNEITLREINAYVELEAVSLYSIANVYALKASSQEKMDLMLMFPGSNYMTSFANNNMIMPLDEYVEEWGSNIKEVMGEKLKATTYKDSLYAIPQNKDVRANAWGFNLSNTLCEKYDIDPSAIKSIEDLEEAFALIKENEPEITVLMPETNGGSIAEILTDYYDSCGSGAGVLEKQEDGMLKIVNRLETENFIEACKKTREWYEKGYISKDVLTTQEAGSSALAAGKCFATAVTSINPNMGDKDYKSVLLKEEKPLAKSSDDQMLLWGVSSSCERPEKAIQFLNLCVGSEEISNLMMYGVEDVHYSILEDGTIDVSKNANWLNYWNMFGDYNKEYVTANLLSAMPGAETLEDYKSIMSAWEVEESPAYGFSFDPTNVKSEIAACDAVNDQYQLAIVNGTVDVETELEKYIQKLYEVGLQKVIDEKQAQLDKWVASQE